MTFLEYVCERLMGPPARRTGTAGDSYWCCPFHDDTHPSFHTMPHKAEYKDRWRCFGCGMGGDEADLMAGLMPGEDWNRRRARLMEWRQDYEREGVATASRHFFPGTGRRTEAGTQAEKPQDDPRAVAAVWADLTPNERDTLLAARSVMQGKIVSFEALAKYCLDFVEWMRQTEEAGQPPRAATGLTHQRNGRV